MINYSVFVIIFCHLQFVNQALASSALTNQYDLIFRNNQNNHSFLPIDKPTLEIEPEFDYFNICDSIKYNYFDEITQLNKLKDELNKEINSKDINIEKIKILKKQIKECIDRLISLSKAEINSPLYHMRLSWNLSDDLSFNNRDPDFDNWKQLASQEKYDLLTDKQLNIIWNNIRIPKHKILYINVTRADYMGISSNELLPQLNLRVEYQGLAPSPQSDHYYLPNYEKAYLVLTQNVTALEICQFLPSLQIYTELNLISSRFNCGINCEKQNVILEVQ